MRRLVLALLCTVNMVCAQVAPGDWLVVSNANPGAGGLYALSPWTGRLSTLLPSQSTSYFQQLVMGTNNTDMACVFPYYPDRLVSVTPTGAMSTIGLIPAAPFGIDLDQDGTYICTSSSAGGSLHRLNPTTGTSALVTTLPLLSMDTVTDVVVDQDSGDYVVSVHGFPPRGMLLRVDRSTLSVTTIVSGLGYVFAVDYQPLDGRFIFASNIGSYIGCVTRSGTVSTLSQFLCCPVALKVEKETGNILACSQGGTIGLLSPIGTVITSRVFQASGAFVADVDVYGSRKISGDGNLTAGTPYSVRLSFPRSPGAGYVMAMSLAPRPGIALPFPDGRVIGLAMDALFFLSFGGIPGITTGFSGVLDNVGRATATIIVPPRMPGGIRVFISAVAINPQMPFVPIDIAGTLGVTTN